QAAPVISEVPPQERRRFARYSFAAPMDVVVLRSGIPSTIPGRCLDLAEGGVAAIMAGELQPGESVGLEIKLPTGMEPVQAKAVVRDQRDLLCRLQFVGMRADSYAALRAWVQIVEPQRAVPQVAKIVGEKKVPPTGAMARIHAKERRRRQSRKAKWMALSPLIVVLTAVLGWWAWQNGWITTDSEQTAQ